MLHEAPFLTPAILATSFNSVKSQNLGVMMDKLPYAIHFQHGLSSAPLYDIEFGFRFTPEDQTSLGKVLKAITFVIDLVQEETQKRMFIYTELMHLCCLVE